MLITVGSVLRDGEENKYILDEMIGSGGFANVFKAHRESDGQLFAVKTLSSINSQLPPNIVSVIIRMLEKPIQKRFTNWADVLKSLQAEPMPKDKIHNFVDTALETRNAADIRLQEKLTEEKRLAQAKEDFCRLIYSQYDSTVIEPIRNFISRFNSQYAGTGSYKLTPERGFSNGERFSSTITTPSNNRIQIEMEAILKENHVRKVHVDRIFRDEGYRNENYIPQCEKRDILAWGRVYDSNGLGFNLLLLKAGDSLYGDWFILTNTNSGLGRSTRPEPFGFKLDELPKEIGLLRAVHIYNSDLKLLTIENVIGFISGCA